MTTNCSFYAIIDVGSYSGILDAVMLKFVGTRTCMFILSNANDNENVIETDHDNDNDNEHEHEIDRNDDDDEHHFSSSLFNRIASHDFNNKINGNSK